MIYYKCIEPFTISIICNSIKSVIEIIMDNYLFKKEGNSYKFINNTLTNNLDGKINEMAKEFIKSVLLIFDDINDFNVYKIKEIKDILMDLINYIHTTMDTNITFTNSINMINVQVNTLEHKECLDKFIEILQNEVVAYFDTVIPKLLNLWMAIIENIFKYYINLNRIIQTKLILEKK